MREILAKAVRSVLLSRRGVASLVVCATVLVGLLQFAVSNWFIGANLNPRLHAALQASIVALGAGFAFWVILTGLVERLRNLETQLHRVAELNHSVRNSLEVIVLAHHAATVCENKNIVLECTEKIDQKLRELFPAMVDGHPGKPGKSTGRVIASSRASRACPECWRGSRGPQPT